MDDIYAIWVQAPRLKASLTLVHLVKTVARFHLGVFPDVISTHGNILTQIRGDESDFSGALDKYFRQHETLCVLNLELTTIPHTSEFSSYEHFLVAADFRASRIHLKNVPMLDTIKFALRTKLSDGISELDRKLYKYCLMFEVMITNPLAIIVFL